MELKGEIHKFTIKVRDDNILLPTLNKTTRQKINKDLEEMNTISFGTI